MDIATLRKKPHLSASSINDYLDCGLLFKFSRVDRIPIEFKSDALVFGSAIHKVLEGFHGAKLIGRKQSLKDIHEAFERVWTRMTDGRDDIQYKEGKSFKTYLLEGRELLTTYYNKLPDDDFKVIGIEEPFSFKLDGLPIPIIGAMDLIEEDEAGTVIITDFKTAGRSYSIDEVDKSLQLTIYQLAARANGYADREILLRFDCLIKTKTPKFEQYYTTRSEIDEKRTAKKIRRVWEAITRGVFIPNDGHWKCKGCAFKENCDEWFKE